MSEWSVYLIRCGDGSLYTGIATDVARRFSEHQRGARGSRYLRGRGPLSLVFQHAVGSRSDASRVEHVIRKLPKRDKEDTAALPDRISRLLAKSGEAVKKE